MAGPKDNSKSKTRTQFSFMPNDPLNLDYKTPSVPTVFPNIPLVLKPEVRQEKELELWEKQINKARREELEALKKAEIAKRTFKITDARKVRATTGQPMRPESDFLTGYYDPEIMKEVIGYAKNYNVDPYTALAIGLGETKFGQSDPNIGHVTFSTGTSNPSEKLVRGLIEKNKYAENFYKKRNLGKPSEEAILQAYQGYGIITPRTEKDYHGFEMDKIFGVPIPKEGLNMLKTNLKGKDVIDIRENVLKKDPKVVKLVNETERIPLVFPGLLQRHELDEEPAPSLLPGPKMQKHGGWVYPANTAYPAYGMGGRLTEEGKEARKRSPRTYNYPDPSNVTSGPMDQRGNPNLVFGDGGWTGYPDHTMYSSGMERFNRVRNYTKYADGGPIEPYYTFNPNDPRIQSYQDSLYLYNKGLQPFLDKSAQYNKSDYIPSKNWGKTKIKKADILHEIKTVKDEKAWTLDHPYNGYKKDIKIFNANLNLLNKSLNTGIYPTNMIYPESYTGALIYKKPVQPVIYKHNIIQHPEPLGPSNYTPPQERTITMPDGKKVTRTEFEKRYGVKSAEQYFRDKKADGGTTELKPEVVGKQIKYYGIQDRPDSYTYAEGSGPGVTGDPGLERGWGKQGARGILAPFNPWYQGGFGVLYDPVINPNSYLGTQISGGIAPRFERHVTQYKKYTQPSRDYTTQFVEEPESIIKKRTNPNYWSLQPGISAGITGSTNLGIDQSNSNINLNNPGYTVTPYVSPRVDLNYNFSGDNEDRHVGLMGKSVYSPGNKPQYLGAITYGADVPNSNLEWEMYGGVRPKINDFANMQFTPTFGVNAKYYIGGKSPAKRKLLYTSSYRPTKADGGEISQAQQEYINNIGRNAATGSVTPLYGAKDPIFSIMGGLPGAMSKIFSSVPTVVPVKPASKPESPKVYSTSVPPPHKGSELRPELEPYISSRSRPATKDEQIFESFLSPQRRWEKQEERTTYYDYKGNVVPRPKKEKGGTVWSIVEDRPMAKDGLLTFPAGMFDTGVQRADALQIVPNFSTVTLSSKEQSDIANAEHQRQVDRARKIAERKKELDNYYSQSGLVSGIKDPKFDTQKMATAGIDYEQSVKDDPIGTIGVDLALGVLPEAAMALRYKMLKGVPTSLVSKTAKNNLSFNQVGNPELVAKLRQELADKGILESQKTFNFPWKEPIRKGIEPFGYSDEMGESLTGSKFKDVAGAIFGGKNPLYISEADFLKRQAERAKVLKSFNLDKGTKADNTFTSLVERSAIQKEPSLKKALNIKDEHRLANAESTLRANRYATWDMYLGKPQTKHPMYDVSELTNSKDNVIYTIKKDFINTKQVEKRLNEYMDEIAYLENRGKTRMKMIAEDDMFKQGDSWIIPDHDAGIFGTMGGFHWEVTKMPDGNYKVFANDVWDLHPLQKNTKLPKVIRNIEAGKALGIGKPLNVKVGFIIDKDTKKIINTFGVAPAAVAGTIASQKQKQGGKVTWQIID